MTCFQCEDWSMELRIKKIKITSVQRRKRHTPEAWLQDKLEVTPGFC